MPNLHQKQPKIAGIVNATLTGVRSREIPAPPIPPPAHTSPANALPGCSPPKGGGCAPSCGHTPGLPHSPAPTPQRGCLLQICPDAFGGDAASDAASAERGAAPGTHTPRDQENGWRTALALSTRIRHRAFTHITRVTPEGPSPSARPSRRTSPAHTCTGSPCCNEIPGDRQGFRRRKTQGKLPRSPDSTPQLAQPKRDPLFLLFYPDSTSPNFSLQIPTAHLEAVMTITVRFLLAATPN